MSEEIAAPETGADVTPVTDVSEGGPNATTIQVEEGSAQPSEDAQQQDDKPKPDRVAKRFSELSSQRDAAKQEAEYWRQQALGRQQADPEPAQTYDDNPFSPEAVQAAVQRALAEERRMSAERDAQQAQADKARGLQAKLYESGLEGAVLIASGADIPFTQAMIDALAVSEQAAPIAHHLGTNPQEAARIAALPPQLQGYELAKLESRLASQPKTTSAPPPPNTVGSRGSSGGGLRDDMSVNDWVQQYRQQMRSR